MKLLIVVSVISFALTQKPAVAQGAAKASHPATTHTSAAAHSDLHGCVKLEALSPKIPALPSAASCPKALYVVSKMPVVKLDYVSPMEDQAALHETFGIDSSSVTLAYVDTKVGTGPIVAHGKFDSLLYTGYLTDGTEFDSSAKHGNEPIVIQYGEHNVIPGWDTGLDGMRVGGKRRLFIPYELAYGAAGHPPAIPAKAELIFDVELVSQSDERPMPKPAPAPPTSTVPKPSATPATPPPAASPAGAQPAAPAPPTAAKPAAPATAQPAPAAKQ
ncbi:MAG TPA: FKBP-type peptidyl-prolyl cis-trans isomerase [Acidobacteriaceae bacterium]|nr:FKBP-type peptidyl-prolyl cis-trans isomerase [Acidobacteriaceae bacterium]